MSKAERAVQRLYEDIGLRDELKDDEATILLKWAEDRVVELDQDTEDEETFEAQFKQLRRMMKRVNHFIGSRANGSPEERQASIDKFVKIATALGIQIDDMQMQRFMQVQQSLSDEVAIQSMLGLLKGRIQPCVTPPEPKKPKPASRPTPPQVDTDTPSEPPNTAQDIWNAFAAPQQTEEDKNE